jgi:hypothetical protein
MDEDIFNGLAELAYFENYALTYIEETSSSHSPACLFLPTSFLSDARRLYAAIPRQYSTEITNLRHRLQVTSVQSIAITSVINDHFTVYVYHVGTMNLDHGDSMHQPPSDDILQIFSWIFSGLVNPPVNRILPGSISRQGGSDGGDGSCGIAVLNFIQGHADGTHVPWQGSQSQLFRDNALQNVILFHHIAGLSPTRTFHSWVQDACTLSSDYGINPSLASGYTDFNMYLPLVSSLLNF